MAAFLAAQQLCLPHLFTTFKGRILQRVFEHPPTLKDGWGGLYMYQIPLESKMKFGISECPPRRRREWERQCWPEQQVWLPWYCQFLMFLAKKKSCTPTSKHITRGVDVTHALTVPEITRSVFGAPPAAVFSQRSSRSRR
ncbi:hypothetical protein DFH06DRAFT_1129785 [Mycena polygramma]|nr:hypothetical protein DFH06DRAFT_1129785 [Mycena polygramma]